MEAINIEILNPKAMQLLLGMQDLNLIKVKKESASALMEYLKKTRIATEQEVSESEIADIVEEVRTERYAKK